MIRPSDAAEVVQAWRAAVLNAEGPTALVFTRQNLPVLDRAECAPAEGLLRGGYVLWRSGEGEPQVILIGDGVRGRGFALEAGPQARRRRGACERGRHAELGALRPAGRQLPSREDVLPRSVRARVAVEAGARVGWEHYVGLDGAVRSA